MREPLVGPARSKNHGMHGVFMREIREGPSFVRLVDHWVDRSGNAKAVSLGWMGSRMAP